MHDAKAHLNCLMACHQAIKMPWLSRAYVRKCATAAAEMGVVIHPGSLGYSDRESERNVLAIL